MAEGVEIVGTLEKSDQVLLEFTIMQTRVLNIN